MNGKSIYSDNINKVEYSYFRNSLFHFDNIDNNPGLIILFFLLDRNYLPKFNYIIIFLLVTMQSKSQSLIKTRKSAFLFFMVNLNTQKKFLFPLIILIIP